MSKKPSIDEQIEAMRKLVVACEYAGGWESPEQRKAAGTAMVTLKWVKRHAPLIKTILEEFPGATVNPREEE
jgi:hypothetical protein